MTKKKKEYRYTKERRERMAKALQLREQGGTYEQIGRVLGISLSRAYQDIEEALKEITREPAEHVLKVELRRLDRLWQVAYQESLKGDMKAMDRAIKIMERRARYLGLDSPQQLKIASEEVDLDAAMNRIMEAAEYSIQHSSGLPDDDS